MPILMGIFLILHGLVHMLYAGQSWRLFELRPGMLWPGGSWLFSRLIGDDPTRYLASGALALASISLLVGGLGLFFRQAWWRPVTIGGAIFSIVIFLVLWNGKLQAVDEQGGVGLLISIVILGVAIFLKWPV
jgi:hypothetical protein